MDIFDQKGISPMLISEQVDPYDDPDSIFEIKIDGIRCIAYCDDSSVDLRNKRNVKLLPRFPELNELYKGCSHKCILDGELNILVNGKPDFYKVQRRCLLTDPFKIQLAYTQYPANFVAYDILYYKDKAINNLSLIERKDILDSIISTSNILASSKYIENNGKLLFDIAKKEELEGVVGKKKSSLYWFGKRTKEWNKIKLMEDTDLICVGYILKPKHMTSLVMALYDQSGNLTLTNHVTLGVSLLKLRDYGIKQTSCPLKQTPRNHDNVVWIEPLVCTVEYMPSNSAGLRQAVFKYFRDDKDPKECIL